MSTRIDRFYISDLQAAELSDQVSVHKIRNVLRKKTGDEIVLFDGKGSEFSACLQDVTKRRVIFDKIRLLRRGKRSDPEMTLAFGLLKADHVDLIVQRCTELGIDVFQPFISDHTAVGKPRPEKFEHWRRVIAESTAQSRRLWMPELKAVVGYEDLCASFSEYDLVLTGDPYGVDDPGLLRGLQPRQEVVSIRRILLVIGPEGGLSATEVRSALDCGGRGVRISSFMLRAETAAIHLSGLAAYYFDKGDA